jgi:hypothetical protein
MNYMIYGKHKDDKSYGAMDLSTGSVGVGLMYATLVPNFERAKHYVDTLAAQIKDFSFQVRGAGTSKVYYTGGQSG